LTSEVTSHTERPRGNAGWFVVVAVVLLGTAYVYLFQRPLLDGIIGQNGPQTVVSLGNPQGLDTATAQQAPSETVEDAIDASAIAQRAAAAKEFQAVLAAIRPKMAQALGVATEEAELAAEAANDPEEKLAKAKRTLEGGKAPQALAIYKDVLDQDARNAEATTGVAWCYIEMGRFNEAASNFRRASELDPKDGDALIGLGTAERQRGNLRAAFDAYDLYLGRHPKGAKATIARYQLDALRKQLGL
jgi:tetratricopeptide (TPR) repeat protein